MIDHNRAGCIHAKTKRKLRIVACGPQSPINIMIEKGELVRLNGIHTILRVEGREQAPATMRLVDENNEEGTGRKRHCRGQGQG